MTPQEEIEQIELGIEDAKTLIEAGKQAEELAVNPLFKKIVMEGYFKEEASRLALLFSDPMLDDSQREMVKRDLCGPGAFKRFLSMLVQMGRQAEVDLQQAEATIEEIRAEDGEDATTVTVG